MSCGVDVEATGRVEDDDVAPGPARLRDAVAADVHDRRCPAARCGHGHVDTTRPSVTSWSTAAGRYGSAATSIGWRPWRTIQRASLAEEVVLPEPWRPTIAMTAGEPVIRNVRSPAPRMRGQLLVDDLDDRLAGVDVADDLGADRRVPGRGR